MRLLKRRELLVLALLVAMILAVSTVNPAVLRPITLINIVNSSLFLILIAIGQMFVVLTRGIDVSVGAIAGLSAVIFGLALDCQRAIADRDALRAAGRPCVRLHQRCRDSVRRAFHRSS